MDYNLNDLSPITNIEALVEKLNYFYFRPMVGGLANDGDQFEASLIFRDRRDFLDKMNKLSIEIKTLPPDNPTPILGKGYSGEEMSKFRFPIRDFPDMESPGHQAVEGTKCYISVHNGAITFIVSGTGADSPYSFTMADYNACMKLEEVFDRCGFRKERNFEIEKYGRLIPIRRHN
jgi:hypothetical protein